MYHIEKTDPENHQNARTVVLVQTLHSLCLNTQFLYLLMTTRSERKTHENKKNKHLIRELDTESSTNEINPIVYLWTLETRWMASCFFYHFEKINISVTPTQFNAWLNYF